MAPKELHLSESQWLHGKLPNCSCYRIEREEPGQRYLGTSEMSDGVRVLAFNR